MSRYQPYPNYKESGVEWLWKVPEHWFLVSLKWISKIYSGGTPDKTNLSYWSEGTIPWLSSGEVNQFYITTPTTYITEDAYSKSSAKWIPKDALVMALAGQGKTKGMVAQLGIDTTCNQSMAAIVLSEKIYPRFILWWLSGNYENIRNLAGGDLRDGLNLELLGGIYCPFIEFSEQTAIANFLDRETSKIDILISKQERMIELLGEKRSAMISHAVTKGIDPDVAMKDSGVEWLGEIPKHWEIIQSRRLFSERKERAQEGDEQLTASQKYGIISQQEFMELEGRKVVQVITGSEILKRAYENDFVISMRSFQGGLEWCKRIGSMSSAYIALIPIKHVIPQFFVYLFKSKPYIQALQSTSNLVRDGQALRFENFSLVDLVIIPDEEQRAIADYLDNQTTKIDTLIAKARQAIELMKERRTALISAAVTGKIDVRGMV